MSLSPSVPVWRDCLWCVVRATGFSFARILGPHLLDDSDSLRWQIGCEALLCQEQ